MQVDLAKLRLFKFGRIAGVETISQPANLYTVCNDSVTVCAYVWVSGVHIWEFRRLGKRMKLMSVESESQSELERQGTTQSQ